MFIQLLQNNKEQYLTNLAVDTAGLYTCLLVKRETVLDIAKYVAITALESTY